jgi:hypothetical protein
MTDAATPYEFPLLADVRDWIAIPESVMPDEQLQTVLDAEQGAQAQLCRVDPWAPQLTQAIYRRVGREVAAMALPLGVTDPSGEFGGSNLPRYDVEIERLERPFRLVVLG